jgi:PAS domain S-box-containing protein
MKTGRTYEELERRLEELENEVLALRGREDLLLREKQFHESIFDRLQEIFIVVNRKSELVRWNRQFEKFSEYLPEEIAGMSALDFFEGEDRDEVARGIEEAFQEGASSGELVIKSRHGRKTSLFFTGARVTLGDEDLLGALGVDVTELKKVERALRESEARFRFLAENTGDVLYRLRYESMNYDYLSPSIEKVTGYTPDEIMAMGFSRLVLQIEVPGKGIVPCDLVAQDRREGKVGEFQADYFIRTKTGELRWLRDHSFPWVDETGRVIGSVGILTEVTERKQGELKLRESEERFRQMFEKSLAVMMLIDPDSGNIVDANPAACGFYGHGIDDIKCMNVSAINMLGRKEITDKMAAAFREKQNHFHFAHRLASGEIREVEVYSSPLEFQGRRLLHSIVHDITDRKRAEEALRESERHLRFLSSRLLMVQEQERTQLAQELHNSIGQTFVAVKLGLESSLDIVGRGDLQAVEQSLQNMIPMAQTAVEEVRRIYMDLRPTVLDDFGIAAAIGWLRREFQKQNPQSYVELEITIDESEIPDRIKPVLFRTAQEALENVARHSKADLVHLSLLKTYVGVELTVADCGVGFDLESVFSVHDAGRGIGLASMRERVELSGGSFLVDSVPGEGTAVRAEWPLEA